MSFASWCVMHAWDVKRRLDAFETAHQRRHWRERVHPERVFRHRVAA